MNKIHQLLKILPRTIVGCLESPEYAELFHGLSIKFKLTNLQRDLLENLVVDIFLKDITVSDVLEKIHELFGFDTDRAYDFTEDIVREFVIPFPDYFEDGARVLDMLGGDSQATKTQSKFIQVLTRLESEELLNHIQKIRTLDIDRAKSQFHYLIEKNLLEYLYFADHSVRKALNELAVDFFANIENYHTELLHAVYQNEQIIGNGVSLERDEKTYPPHTAQWIKDFISFSGGDPSTINIARYVTQNKNARRLVQKDRDVLRYVLEIYRVLKLFPESLEHIPFERWMIIPYDTEEKSLPQEEHPVHIESGHVKKDTRRVENNVSSSTVLPPALRIPELPAPSSSLHGLAPVAVQTQTIVAKKPEYEEMRYEFSLDHMPEVIAQKDLGNDAKNEKQKVSFSGKNYKELADEVLLMSGIFASDPVLHTRLQNIVITRLKNIRTAIEIRERLSDPAERGGFGLSPQAANSIVRNANIVTDLLSQGVLSVGDGEQKQTPIEMDIREIKELVRREFSSEQKKFGRSRPMSHTVHPLHLQKISPPFVLPALPKSAPLGDIKISIQRPSAPLPPHPEKQLVVSSRSPAAAEEKKERMRSIPPTLQSQGKMVVPPVKIRETYTAIPPKLDMLSFRKNLKPVPTVYSPKLSLQQIPKDTEIRVSHKQPHSFFGATDIQHVEHTGLPAISIEEVDGVPMIVEKQKETQSKEEILRAEALKKEIQKKEEERRARMEERIAAEERRAQEDVQKVKKEEKEKEKEKEMQMEVRKEEELQKIEQSTPVKPAQEPLSVQKSEPESPSTGAMPQAQAADQKSGSLFSNIFHIPVNVKTTPQQPGKVSFSDVKTSPRLIDTVEELRIFILKDFRRLSEDPLNAASRIYDKIQSLERESFTKKLMAIAAWRESEVNVLYVQIGQEALLKGKSITSVIDQLKAEGKPYLTEQEFDAVLELNERIRM